MKPPFDISGDLNTPVSAYLKLAPFRPRFLLESVEGGERLGRYSFIGFGDALDLRLDRDGLFARRRRGCRRPPTARSCSPCCAPRSRPRRARSPSANGMPLAGGLVGYASYDIVRLFERLPSRRRPADGLPLMHYVAPASLLVFDHVTRGIALLHAGPEAERASLRREVSRALQGGLPERSGRARIRPAARRGSTATRFLDAVRRAQEHIAAGDVYQLVLSILLRGPPRRSTRSRSTARCARSIPRPTCTSARSTT